MNLSQEDIWNSIGELKKLESSIFYVPDVSKLLCHILKKYQIEDQAAADELNPILKHQLRLYRNRDRHKKPSSQTIFSYFHDETPCIQPKISENPPVKRKSFCDLKPQMQIKRSDDLLATIQCFLNEENQNSKNPLTMTQLLGYLIHRVNYIDDKKTAKLGMDIFKKQHLDRKEFSTLDAISIMHELTLSKVQMRTLKSYLSSKGIVFPNTNELLEARKKLRPVIKTEFSGDGVFVNYKDLVQSTSLSLLSNVIDKEKQALNSNKPVTITYKDGGDTAGSQTVWKSVSMKDASDHIFQYGLVPLRVEQDDKIIWKNPSPNAASSCRPIYLLRASEDEQRVKDLVPSTTDEGRKELMAGPVYLTSEEQVFEVNHVIHSSMKDLKLKKTWSGLGGADCIMCESRRDDWKDPAKINMGFPITRVAEETYLLYEQLAAEGNGDILRSHNDYVTRKGLTTKPLTTDDQHNLCITHSYINCLGWFLKLLYRCNICYESWIEKSTILGEPIRRAKIRVQEIFIEKGLILDQVSGSNSKGGTSNDGNQARRFFSQKYADIVVSCVDDKYKDIIRELHMNLSIVLRVISSFSQVDHVKLDEMTRETSILLATRLPWVYMNFTLHGVLHHSAELIYLNKGWSIGTLSEEPLESNNKFVRRYLQQYARTTCPVLQLTDAMSRLLERSNPDILFHQKSSRRNVFAKFVLEDI